MEALLLLAGRGRPGEAYNICGETVCTAREILEMIGDQLNFPLRPEIDPLLLRPSDEPLIAGDVAKLRRDTGWRQKYSLEQTVADMLEYWQKQGRKIGNRKESQAGMERKPQKICLISFSQNADHQNVIYSMFLALKDRVEVYTAGAENPKSAGAPHTPGTSICPARTGPASAGERCACPR